MRRFWDVIRRTVREFMRDDCMSMAGSLAYSTIFALPPILLLALLIVGSIFDEAAASERLRSQIADLIGPAAAEQTQDMIQRASESLSKRGVALLVAIGALLIGASGAFAQLQGSLNRAWGVRPDPNAAGVRAFLMRRVLSFGMILAIAFLLLVSLVVSAALAALGRFLEAFLPAGISQSFLHAAQAGLSFIVITLLFAAILKVLPDAQLEWRDVWVGAILTSILFGVGKELLSFYLARSNPGNVFGAAGSLALLLVWIYYSSMILLAGAEFTQVWARSHGREVQPERGAILVPRAA